MIRALDAVFTEQGSSASQMTAAKVMDVIARLPGCGGPAADAVSAHTHVKMEDVPIGIQKSNARMSRNFGYVYQNTNGQNHGLAWKTQLFLLSEICTVILWQDYYRKGKSRRFYWNTVGESSKLGMPICEPRKRTILVCVCGRHKNWLGRNETLTQC